MRLASLLATALAVGWAWPAHAQDAKKDAWFAAKAAKTRSGRRIPHRALPRRAPEHVVTLKNLWTHESLPISTRRLPRPAVVSEFLRCHSDQAHHAMDRRLLPLILRAARRFHSDTVEIISGYRSPAFNAQLRSQGHQVARESQHTHGRAVDFRLPSVPTERLLAFVKSQGLGGVGFYPHSRFVHADTGPVRFWRGR